MSTWRDKFRRGWRSGSPRIVAISELSHVLELASRSGSSEVQAFGALMATRIAAIADGETEVYVDSEEELRPVIEYGRVLNQADETATFGTCRECGRPVGEQHRPSCNRQGAVTGESLL